MKSKKLKGFTLAEVLITLVIIGVVAALTVPNLLHKHRKQVIETRLKKFYSSINQAIQLSELENGKKETWEANDVKAFWDKYLKNYLKYDKIDESCLNLTYKGIMIYFQDGSAVKLTHATDYQGQHYAFFPYAGDASCKATTTTPKPFRLKSWVFFYSAKPDHFGNNGKYHVGKGVEPYRVWWDGNPNTLYTRSDVGCSETGGKHYCTAIVQDNGWVIPDNFPLRY